MGPEHVDILLVDDSPDDTAFVLHALKSAGLTPTMKCARDGAEAISLIFGATADQNPAPVLRPRLIILDLKLPKIDGKEVLRRLKGNSHSRSIPVVVWSSSLEKRDVGECYALGVNGYLVKPLDVDAYVDCVRAVVNYWLRFNQTPPA